MSPRTSTSPAAGSPGTSLPIQATEPDPNRISTPQTYEIDGDEKFGPGTNPRRSISSVTPPVPTVDQDEKTGGGDETADETVEESDNAGDGEFKEGGYGWVVVFCVLLINAHTWGMNSAYSVFLAYYLRSNILSGGTPTAYAFVGGLSISIALLVSPVATVSIRLYGTRNTLFIGVALETAAFIGASFTTEIWHLVLSQGIAFGIGMGFLFVGCVGVTPQWFNKKRSFANAVASSGSGFGGVCYSLATNAMIKNIGLPWAFRVLAILAFAVNGICSMLMRDRNKQVGAVHVAFNKVLFKKIEFWMYVSWGFFSLLSYTIVIFSLPDYAQTVGLSASQGSVIAACFNVSQALGRPVIGLVSDRVGRINIAALGTLVAGLAAFFIWIFAGKYYAGAIIYALLGCFAGLLWATIAPVGAEVFGLQLLPSVLSVTWLALVLPGTFAEVIGLSLRTHGINGYLHCQIFAGIMYMVAFASAWALRVWKLHEMDALGLTKRQRNRDVRNPDRVAAHHPSGGPGSVTRKKVSTRSIIRSIFSIERV